MRQTDCCPGCGRSDPGHNPQWCEVPPEQTVTEQLLEACETILNVEGAASRAARWIKVDQGLDVRFHFDKVRAAILRAKREGISSK